MPLRQKKNNFLRALNFQLRGREHVDFIFIHKYRPILSLNSIGASLAILKTFGNKTKLLKNVTTVLH